MNPEKRQLKQCIDQGMRAYPFVGARTAECIALAEALQLIIFNSDNGSDTALLNTTKKVVNMSFQIRKHFDNL